VKIDNSTVQSGSLNATEQAQQTQAQQGGVRGHKHARSPDHVELSSFAQAYATDSARMEQLRAAYESGTYHVSPNQVAAGIMSYMMN
jgi:anti-sigma28 factor (negative regulator of flagellin synthesis)